MADKIFYFVFFGLFINIALAIGDGPGEMDAVRVLVIAIFTAVCARYQWPQAVSVRVFCTAEILLWLAILAIGIYYRLTYAIIVWVAFLMVAGIMILVRKYPHVFVPEDGK